MPWTSAEARTFLAAAKDDPLYPAFVLLLLYGLRRGEVLGLRWHDVDEAGGEIRVRQQIQRIGGELRAGPVELAAARRDLPLLSFAGDVLSSGATPRPPTAPNSAGAWLDNGLVFTTRTGRPVEPRNLVRSFRRISSAHGLRVIKVHHLRDTTASAQEPGRSCPGCSVRSRPFTHGGNPGDLHP